jgi:hypothetical protein
MKTNQEKFYNTLLEAFQNFVNQFDNWVFDERDSAQSLETYINELLGREMTSEEMTSVLFKTADKQANEVLSNAEGVGYCHRLADQMNPNYGREAELKFKRTKEKYPNF